MSKKNNDSFGDYIRQLREDRKLSLRKVAAQLDIDTSTLCKIEKNERNANIQIIEKLSEIFSINRAELKILYLSDLIICQLLNEEDGIEILRVVEQKLNIHKHQQMQ